jgi:hypothetical protein
MGIVIGIQSCIFSRETTFVPEGIVTVVPSNDICVIEFPNVVTCLYSDVFSPLIALSESMMEKSVRPLVSFQTT